MTDSKTDRPQDEEHAGTHAPATNAAHTLAPDQADTAAPESAAQDDSAPATQADGLGEWASAIAELQDAASQVVQQSSAPATSGATSVAPIFQPLTGSDNKQNADVDLIMNVPVQLTVELGRSRMTIKNLLQLGQGSVVELDGLAGEPMDIYVNGYLIAQGEVVVVEDRYGIRVTDIITPSERINRLNNRR